MKILFLIRSLDHGGAERQVVALAKTLHAGGHQAAVAVFYGDGPLRRDLDAAGVPVFDLKKAGRWDLPAFFGRLLGVVRSFRPDILHGYLPTSDILAAVLKPLVPGLKVAFGVRASDMDLGRYDRLSAASYWVEARLSRLADIVISNSETGRQTAVARGFPADRCRVVPNGIDTARFRPDRAAGRTLRQQWGIGDQQRLVGMVARIDPMKGHETFIRAAAIASAQDPDLRFVCVGRGDTDLTARLRHLADSLDVPVIWPGSINEVESVYNALDQFVLASEYGEGFPNVLAEALACGVPAIATHVGDAAVILEGLGDVVSPGDVEALAQAMLKAAPVPNLFAAQVIAEKYSLESLADRTLAALHSL